MVSVDHTLAAARHWGGLPAETVVIEVEPADCSFGLGFSEALAASFDPILATVRDELNCPVDYVSLPDFEADLATAGVNGSDEILSTVQAVEPSAGLAELVHYAHEHKQARLLHSHRGAPLLDRLSVSDGVTLAGRSRPWGVTWTTEATGST